MTFDLVGGESCGFRPRPDVNLVVILFPYRDDHLIGGGEQHGLDAELVTRHGGNFDSILVVEGGGILREVRKGGMLRGT